MAITQEAEKRLFKDWFDKDAVVALAQQLYQVYPDFDKKAFRRRAMRDLDSLEMMARVGQFAEAMRAGLPKDIPSALEIIVKSLQHEILPLERNAWLVLGKNIFG